VVVFRGCAWATHPKMTAFQRRMLLSVGAPDTPTGGSSCSRLKSLMSLRLAGVDMSVLVCGWLGEVGEGWFFIYRRKTCLKYLKSQLKMDVSTPAQLLCVHCVQ